jgi:UDP-N-acetylglucosamine 4,6-dehydratase
VLGSRGSVVPVFQKLIAEGAKTLPITDPRMTRFWITLDQGVAFVLSCLPMMRGGEIFVPKIPSMKVVDMATVLAPDLPHEVVGIRPGEKLHEVMITEDDAVSTMELSDRFVIEPAIHLWNWESSATDGRKPVAEGFRYASNINDDWMDGETMCELIARMEQ